MIRSLARTTIVLLGILSVCCAFSAAQAKSSSKSGSSGSGGSGASAQSSTAGDASSGNGPFSIETEMFTYKSVEENGEIIACDIARYLRQGELMDAPKDSHVPCTISGGTQTTAGIIIVSSASTLFSNFQIWRADMATMSALEDRADKVCVAAPEKKNGGQAEAPPEPHIRARGLFSTMLGSTTPGEAASTLGTVLQLFSSSQSVSSVVGTVEDPALIDEVARQLRSLNIQVLVPELYNPNALGPADYATSPYLQNLQKLFDSYDKCEAAKSGHTDNSADTAEITGILSSMDLFLKSALGASPADSSNSTQGSSAGAENSTPPSHLAAALAADDVARHIGLSGTAAGGANPTWQHVLWLEALESGGSVTHQSNLFGTKVTFGGGAVDTYAVFRLDGELVCSGNVYNFQTPVGLKNLEKAFRAPPADNPARPFMLHSTCALLPPS